MLRLIAVFCFVQVVFCGMAQSNPSLSQKTMMSLKKIMESSSSSADLQNKLLKFIPKNEQAYFLKNFFGSGQTENEKIEMTVEFLSETEIRLSHQQDQLEISFVNPAEGVYRLDGQIVQMSEGLSLQTRLKNIDEALKKTDHSLMFDLYQFQRAQANPLLLAGLVWRGGKLVWKVGRWALRNKRISAALMTIVGSQVGAQHVLLNCLEDPENKDCKYYLNEMWYNLNPLKLSGDFLSADPPICKSDGSVLLKIRKLDKSGDDYIAIKDNKVQFPIMNQEMEKITLDFSLTSDPRDLTVRHSNGAVRSFAIPKDFHEKVILISGQNIKVGYQSMHNFSKLAEIAVQAKKCCQIKDSLSSLSKECRNYMTQVTKFNTALKNIVRPISASHAENIKNKQGSSAK